MIKDYGKGITKNKLHKIKKDVMLINYLYIIEGNNSYNSNNIFDYSNKSNNKNEHSNNSNKQNKNFKKCLNPIRKNQMNGELLKLVKEYETLDNIKEYLFSTNNFAKEGRLEFGFKMIALYSNANNIKFEIKSNEKEGTSLIFTINIHKDINELDQNNSSIYTKYDSRFNSKIFSQIYNSLTKLQSQNIYNPYYSSLNAYKPLRFYSNYYNKSELLKRYHKDIINYNLDNINNRLVSNINNTFIKNNNKNSIKDSISESNYTLFNNIKNSILNANNTNFYCNKKSNNIKYCNNSSFSENNTCYIKDINNNDTNNKYTINVNGTVITKKKDVQNNIKNTLNKDIAYMSDYSEKYLNINTNNNNDQSGYLNRCLTQNISKILKNNDETNLSINNINTDLNLFNRNYTKNYVNTNTNTNNNYNNNFKDIKANIINRKKTNRIICFENNIPSSASNISNDVSLLSKAKFCDNSFINKSNYKLELNCTNILRKKNNIDKSKTSLDSDLPSTNEFKSTYDNLGKSHKIINNNMIDELFNNRYIINIGSKINNNTSNDNSKQKIVIKNDLIKLSENNYNVFDNSNHTFSLKKNRCSNTLKDSKYSNTAKSLKYNSNEISNISEVNIRDNNKRKITIESNFKTNMSKLNTKEINNSNKNRILDNDIIISNYSNKSSDNSSINEKPFFNQIIKANTTKIIDQSVITRKSTNNNEKEVIDLKNFQYECKDNSYKANCNLIDFSNVKYKSEIKLKKENSLNDKNLQYNIKDNKILLNPTRINQKSKQRKNFLLTQKVEKTSYSKLINFKKLDNTNNNPIISSYKNNINLIKLSNDSSNINKNINTKKNNNNNNNNNNLLKDSSSTTNNNNLKINKIFNFSKDKLSLSSCLKNTSDLANNSSNNNIKYTKNNVVNNRINYIEKTTDEIVINNKISNNEFMTPEIIITKHEDDNFNNIINRSDKCNNITKISLDKTLNVCTFKNIISNSNNIYDKESNTDIKQFSYILVVDDNCLCRRGMYKSIKDSLKTLKISNIKVIKLNDGSDTIQLFSSLEYKQIASRVKIIFSDENMNKVNGSKSFIEINKLILSENSCKNIKIKDIPKYICTALETKSAIEYLISTTNCIKVLNKPISKMIFKDILNDYFCKKSK